VVDEYVRYVAPHLADRVTRWQGDRDAFAEYRIDEQLAKALERKVWLPSGGSLVIDKTEAMTVVDVNTGKFTGQGGNLEETVTRNNLEAAEEIVRQLRLRDVGGIVVIDFIDMVLESNRELVLRRLLECLSRDRTKHQVAEVTSLGLVQMTRKRVGAGLLEAFSTPCECCNGRGVILTFDPDSDGHATQHTHSRGHGNGGNGGNGGRGNGGNGGRGPSPAMVAARARSAESAESSAPAEPSASAPADTPPADATGAPAPSSASASGSALVPADSADPNAAQQANGQVPDAEPAPARSSGRRRRRKPAAAAAPAAPADASASQADTPEAPTTPDTSATTSAAPASPGTPASDSSPVPVTSGAPEPPRTEPSAEITPDEGGALGGAE
jgi:ribonuclease E